LAGAEDAQPGILKQIDNPGRQNIVRTHHGKVDRFPLREIEQLIEFSQLNLDISAELRGPRVSGCDEYLPDAGRLTKLPGKSVFTSATADHQDIHDALYRRDGT
jgi:hypothetical protein